MNIPATLGAKIGENGAVATTGVSEADVKQIRIVAEWYVKSGILPTVGRAATRMTVASIKAPA